MLMLWGAPRSRSTVFYRMMVERGDFTAVFEPFSQAAVFIKDTTDRRHPEVLADRRFLEQDAEHTFLIRHPVTPSRRTVPAPVSIFARTP
jgi:hypothetical protein